MQAATTSKPSTTEPSGPDATSLRRHATGRMRRAIHWSTQLLSHCQALYAASRLSAEDLLQITVYTLILNGRFLRHRYDFEDALIQLSVSRNLLDELAAKAVTSRDQALAITFADEIGPEIRHCAHELRRDKAYDVDAIVNDVAPKHRGTIVEGCNGVISSLAREVVGSTHERKLDALMWEDEPVPVRNPELVDALLKVQDAERRLKEAEQSAPRSMKAWPSQDRLWTHR